MDSQKPDVLKLIRMKKSDLTKREKLIADYILKNYDKAAFKTALKLSETIGVSESTVIRFAIKIGFEGYPQLQKEMKELIKTKITSIQRLDIGNGYISNQNNIENVLKHDMSNIKETMDNLDYETFEKAVSEIVNARKIYIIGMRSAKILAEFLNFYLNIILQNVYIVGHSNSEILEEIFNIEEEDVLIGIGFPRYAIKTLEAMEFARKKNSKIITLTDSYSSPLSQIANLTLIAKSDMASFVDSLVAPLSVLNALIIRVGMKEKEKVAKNFKTLEDIWKEYNIYYKRK